MKKVFFSGKELNRIKKNKKDLEKALNIELEISDSSIIIESKKKDSFIEYIAIKVLDAISLGFDFEIAIQLKDPDFLLKKVDIKSRVKDARVKVVIGRIIGKKGKTKHLIEKLSECDIVICEHFVVVIGYVNNVAIASHAIEALIRGSPQSKVYGILEKSRAKLRDLSEENIEEFIEEKTDESKQE